MKKFYSLAIFVLTTNLLITNVAFCQTNTWDGSSNNNWNTGANWSLNHAPTNAEDAVININASINVDASATVNSLTIGNSATVSLTSSGGGRTITIDNTESEIESGSSLSLHGSSGSGTRSMAIAFSGSNRTISIAGILILTDDGDGAIYNAANSVTTVTGTLKNTGGTITSTTSNLSFSSGGIYEHAVDGGTIPTATWNAGSTCLISVNSGNEPGGLAPTGGFANFKWDCSTGTSATSLVGGLTTINGDFTVAHTGTTGSLRLVNGPGGSNLVLNVGGNFIQTGGTFYIMGTSSSTGSETMKVAGNVSISGGTLQMSGNSLIGALEVKGNFSHTAGTITESSTGSGLISFTGSAPQTLTGGGTVNNTINYTINNTSTTGVTLATAYTIANALTLTDGIVYTDASKLLTISSGGSVSGASDASFIDGPIKKIGNTDFTFPVGKTGTGYMKIALSNILLGGATTEFTAQYFRASASTTFGTAGLFALGLQAVSNCEYWTIVRGVTLSATANITMSWNTHSPCSSGTYIGTPPIGLRVAHFNTSTNTWDGHGGGAVSGNSSVGSITWTAAANFSPFALGALVGSNSPLPVAFADVKAFAKNNGVQIEWSNLTESDIAEYVVERSSNGTDFSSIAQYQPKSNQHDKASYASFDAAPLEGTNFYRIKATEISGKTIYSKVLRAELDKAKQSFTMYPSPVTGSHITINLTGVKQGSYSLRVINNNGQDVFRKTLVNSGNSISETLDLPSTLKSGIYTILVIGDNYKESKKFIIQ